MSTKLSYVCTIGPSMQDYTTLEKMYALGMSSIRFNMSYNNKQNLKLLKLAQEFKKNYPDIELLFDSAGPEIRIITNKKIKFKKDDKVIIGEDFDVSINKIDLLAKGDLILIKDGDYVFEVMKNSGNKVVCKALSNGVISNNNKIYNEKMYKNLPFFSKYDEDVIKMAVDNNIDSFAVSFVRNAQNIKEVRKLLKKYGNENIKIIAKIENKESIEKLDEIIDLSDEVMIARGDLSTLLPRINIGYYQKLICHKCKEKNRPVMVATGIMASMEKLEDPRISEVLDLYNLILDGVDKIVFTSETSVADDPLDVLQTANDILASIKPKN